MSLRALPLIVISFILYNVVVLFSGGGADGAALPANAADAASVAAARDPHRAVQRLERAPSGVRGHHLGLHRPLAADARRAAGGHPGAEAG